MHNFTDNIPTLKIETNEDGTITLEQDWCGNAERVAVHPVHVRHLAERLGMIREVSATDAELLRTERGRVAGLQQEGVRLKRSMLRLREHALALQIDFAEHADWKHADLTHEMNTINSLVSLFDMAVDDFVDGDTLHEPSENPDATRVEPSGFAAARSTVTSPKTDGFEAPPKTGVFREGAAVTTSHATSRQSGPAADGRGASSAPPQMLHPADSAPLKTAPRQLNLEGGHVG